jgi:hypothetical protein
MSGGIIRGQSPEEPADSLWAFCENLSPNDLARQGDNSPDGRGLESSRMENRPRREMGGGNYFKELLIEVNLSFMVVPRPFTTVMIASAMPAAIRPYSIAVAPESSVQNFKIMRFKSRLLFHFKLCGLPNTRKSTWYNLRSG